MVSFCCPQVSYGSPETLRRRAVSHFSGYILWSTGADHSYKINVSKHVY